MKNLIIKSLATALIATFTCLLFIATYMHIDDKLKEYPITGTVHNLLIIPAQNPTYLIILDPDSMGLQNIPIRVSPTTYFNLKKDQKTTFLLNKQQINGG